MTLHAHVHNQGCHVMKENYFVTILESFFSRNTGSNEVRFQRSIFT